jgi:hypothetical protein
VGYCCIYCRKFKTLLIRAAPTASSKVITADLRPPGWCILKEATRLYGVSWVRNIGLDLRPYMYKREAEDEDEHSRHGSLPVVVASLWSTARSTPWSSGASGVPRRALPRQRRDVRQGGGHRRRDRGEGAGVDGVAAEPRRGVVRRGEASTREVAGALGGSGSRTSRTWTTWRMHGIYTFWQCKLLEYINKY